MNFFLSQLSPVVCKIIPRKNEHGKSWSILNKINQMTDTDNISLITEWYNSDANR